MNSSKIHSMRNQVRVPHVLRDERGYSRTDRIVAGIVAGIVASALFLLIVIEVLR